MLNFLFKKEQKDKSKIFNDLYLKVRNLYANETIAYERKKELCSLIERYGYLPYSQARAINELTPSEVILCLEKKLEIKL